MSPFNHLQDYEPVEDRLAKFYVDWPPPHGSVRTEMVHRGEGEYIVRATLYIDGLEVSTGLAQERETERGVNATSALENCETSAIGRALANLGYAAKGKRPSREEMSKASAAGGGSTPAADGPGSTPQGPGATPSGGPKVRKGKADTGPPVDTSEGGTTEPPTPPSGRAPGAGDSSTPPSGRIYPHAADPSHCKHLAGTIVVDGNDVCPGCGSLAGTNGVPVRSGAA